ncbi:MAG TPA: T9SS type A sorting domain-containing protein [Bacteroidetes bacterium]|nr:T9SS type A sorting domain-containing protein [Bacteroidota bacterium]
MSNPGVHTHSWDASGLPSGLYICRMETGGKTASIKLAMVR